MFTSNTHIVSPAMRTAPAISGSVERAAFRASIPAIGATYTRENVAAYQDTLAYRSARAARVIGSH